MKGKLQLVFFFIVMMVICVAVDGQGIGDRNRAASSNGGTYSIAGRVLMPDGRPAKYIKVSVTSADSNPMSFTTNEDGSFQTGDVTAGNYTVSAKVEGFQQVSELVMIDRDAPAGKTHSVVLYLRMPGQPKGDVYSVNPLFKDVPKSALDKFKKGVEKLQSNDAKAAVPFFNAAIQEYPNFAAAYYDLGHAYLREHELDKALESFVKAISIKTDYLDAKYYVGYIQFQKKNFEVAAAVFDDVLKQKEMWEAHYYLGLALTSLNIGDAAIPHLKAAIAKNDGESTALAHRYLGFIYLQKKQNAEAAAELQRFIDLVPKAPDADKLKATIANLKKGS